MKKLIILLYLITGAMSLSAQNFQEWWQQKKTKKQYLIEQVAALQAYGSVIKKGYEVTQQGLGLIHTIKSGDFSQHEAHFQSFSSVNQAVINYSDTRLIIALASRSQQVATHIQTQLKSSKQLSQSEEAQVVHVFSNINHECASLLDELQLLLEKETLSLSDSQRLDRLKQIHTQMKEIYGFTVRIGQEFLQLTRLRKQEFQAIVQSRLAHHIDLP